MAVHRFEGGGGDGDGGDAREPIEVRVERTADSLLVTIDDAEFPVTVLGDAADGSLRLGGPDEPAARIERLHAVDDGDAVSVWWRGRTWRLPVVQRQARRAGDAAAGAAGDEVTAPMPGTVLDVRVAPGDVVARDAVVVVMESMKMEMSLASPRDATVAEVLVAAGDMVEMGKPLVRLAPAEADADPAGTEAGHRGPAGG